MRRFSLCDIRNAMLVFFSFSAAFLTQTVCLQDTTVKFEIWDTAGQERYHSLAPMYYRGAQAAIVVYDITNQVPKQITIANKFVDCCLLTSGCVIPIAWRAAWLLVFAVYARILLLWYRCSWCAWCNFFFPSTKQHYKRWSLELYVLYIDSWPVASVNPY